MSVELSNSRTDLGALAKELDIPPAMLYRWRRELSAKQNGSFPGNGKVVLSETEQELARLKKELRETQMDRTAEAARHSKKGCKHFLQERWQIFGFIKSHRKVFPIEKMCRVFKVSRSGFYTWLRNGLSNTAIENQAITEKIRVIHSKSKQTYGSPRITHELIKLDIKVSRPRVARLMKKAKIRSIVKRKFRVTTDSEHKYPVVENKLNRQFKVDKIATAWVSDITYIKTTQGWLYLTIILDLADRRVIGWALSSTMKAIDTVIPAWKMAQKNRNITSELIFHSDRGIQYACSDFKSLLEMNPLVIRSMSRKANCWDNAVAESFFKTLKAECVYQNKFINKQQAAVIVFEYIEVWYNRKRQHSALGYVSPTEFEENLNKQKIAA